MRTKQWMLGSALGLVVALGSGCPPKRPPALLTPSEASGVATPEAAPQGTLGTQESDLQAIGSEGLSSEDLGGSYPAGGEEAGPLADIYFEFDQATLTDAARAALEKHAAWLQTHRDVRLIVEGHCDERGTVEYNLALGDKRGQAARDYLVSLGVAAGRLRAVSLGKERPIEARHDESAWARNRRAHFVVQR
jgi:peptidoglycan-associated lipoprotein